MSDVDSIRRRAGAHLCGGAVTHHYQGQIEQTIDFRYT